MALVSKKARYAMHGLAYLATFPLGESVPFGQVLGYLKAYSPRLTLSAGYIAKVFQEVSRAGLTVASVGPRGGYQLARPAAQIRLIDVIEALDGQLLPDCCLLSVTSCPGEASCGVRDMLGEAERAFYRFFEEHTLASLVETMHFPSPEAVALAAQPRHPSR
jgi:Rrf2 family protein